LSGLLVGYKNVVVIVIYISYVYVMYALLKKIYNRLLGLPICIIYRIQVLPTNLLVYIQQYSSTTYLSAAFIIAYPVRRLHNNILVFLRYASPVVLSFIIYIYIYINIKWELLIYVDKIIMI